MLFIMAGGNGSGKTTIAKELLPNYFNCTEFVNADIIAEGISPGDVAAVALKAGRMTLKLIDQLFKDQMDFAIETTLSGRLHEKIIRRAQEQGYHVTMFYIWSGSPELSVRRVRQRSRLGGHFVPEEDVVRRYKRGMINFFRTYIEICDTWAILDNRRRPQVLVAGGTSIIDINIFNHDIWTKIISANRKYEAESF